MAPRWDAAGFRVHISCELFLASLRFRFVSRRADFGDHNHRPKTLRISVFANVFAHVPVTVT